MIAGCTEVPLVLSGTISDIPIIDPLRILARAVVRQSTTESSDSALIAGRTASA
jgi:aspartate/glutamate racemase